jgi:hypothetical protein
VDVFESFENGNPTLRLNNQFTGLYLNNQEFFANGFKLIGEITPKFGLNLGIGGAFSGNLVAKQRATTLGLYLKW